MNEQINELVEKAKQISLFDIVDNETNTSRYVEVRLEGELDGKNIGFTKPVASANYSIDSYDSIYRAINHLCDQIALYKEEVNQLGIEIAFIGAEFRVAGQPNGQSISSTYITASEEEAVNKLRRLFRA